MEIILKNGKDIKLVNIPDNELKFIKGDIIEHTFSQEEKDKIYMGCKINEDLSILETDTYKIKKLEKIKLEKKEAIEKIASITDQLNLTAGTLDVLVDILGKDYPEILENPWVIKSKAKLNEIKNILNN